MRVWVNPHTRKGGIKVKGHYMTLPKGSKASKKERGQAKRMRARK